jgi:CheY-like chemotaxis protein
MAAQIVVDTQLCRVVPHVRKVFAPVWNHTIPCVAPPWCLCINISIGTAAKSLALGSMTRSAGNAVKILIIDDNAGVRRLIREVVSELAEEVRECSDGDQSLSAYLDFQPDLVLMDVRMPGMDGLMATKQLKRAYPDARVIIVTDYDDDLVRSAAQEAGACGYALKQNLTILEDLVIKKLASFN